MCGIAGTVFNKNFIDGIEVRPQEIINTINSFKKEKDTSKNLLDLAWKYKSNINFLRYVKDDKEKSLIVEALGLIESISNEIKEKIPNIDKSFSNKEYNEIVLDHQNLLDVSWFLSVEINRWIEDIEFLSSSHAKDLPDEVIILYKDISKVINAIDNRLELRGRDSFGLIINLNSNSFDGDEYKTLDSTDVNASYHSNKKDGCSSYSFSFKTCNSIGALGENATIIKNLIKSNELLNSLIKSNKVTTSTIIAHTRWASVGEVNIHNAHPVEYTYEDNEFGPTKVSSILNGDIYNYKEIIQKAKDNSFFDLDTSKITNDCAAVPAFLSNFTEINSQCFSKIGTQFSGSFIVSVTHSKKPNEIFIVKKGIQGLYLGFSYDGVMFASDVYGLVETCRHFTAIESDKTFSLNATKNISFNYPQIIMEDTINGKELVISKDRLKVTNITTRDIDKKNYEHFLDKEIHDTADIVARTLSNYVQPEKIIEKKNIFEAIALNNEQIPEYIFDSLKNKQINKIIITGMGTCYTAAVAISMYMRSRLKLFMPFILVEPHIATEGSAFYLQPNMQDTLVVVIAQSGTTVDTNVYVQKAKERGAMSLAIANKREGDVTFIVDGTLYIGDGRDIEIAVPSTKTYTAQVILGYILTLAFSTRLATNSKDKDILINDLKNLRSTEKVIKDSFYLLKDRSIFTRIANKGCSHNSWHILRDDTSNSVCADEIRIKYSENCYQSVSSLSILDAINLEVKNSFLVIVTESKISNIEQMLLQLLNSDNSIILICNSIDLTELDNNLLENNNIEIINMPHSDKFFTFLPTIIAGQILSYHQAIVLDSRKDYFINLKESIDNKKDLKKELHNLMIAIQDNKFDQGFFFNDFKNLNNLLQEYLSNDLQDETVYIKLRNQLDNLILNSRRTIDTIKHQAKTITVGAVREGQDSLQIIDLQDSYEENNQKVYDLNIIDKINKTFTLNPASIESLQQNSYGEVLISFEGLDESLAYNISNLINDFSNQFNFHPNIRLARSYDHPHKKLHTKAFWIILTNEDLYKNEKLLDYLEDDQYLLFNFNSWKINDETSKHFEITKDSGEDYKKSLWSMFIGIFLIDRWLSLNFVDDEKNKIVLKKMNFEIIRQMQIIKEAISDVKHSSQIKDSLSYASEIFLSKINWKCIGSGVNFNLSKYTSKRLIKDIGRSCAFDVLENHKHIDISAESSILVFISNIIKKGYQEDAFSELEKLIAHNNIPIILTNEGDERFDSMLLNKVDANHAEGDIKVPVIKIPKVGIQFSYPVNVYVIEMFIKALKEKIIKNNDAGIINSALQPKIKESINANIWK